MAAPVRGSVDAQKPARDWSGVGIYVAATLTAALVWEAVGRVFDDAQWLPPLSEVLITTAEVWSGERFLGALAGSARSLAIGFLIAVVGGIVVGLLMGSYRVVDWALSPYVGSMMAAPKAALIPVIVLIWGIGDEAVIITVVLYSVFAIIYNTIVGVRESAAELRDMSQAFGATRLTTFRLVVLPAASPMISSGVKYGIVRAIKGLIIGEQLVAVVGLGALVMRYAGAFQIRETYSLVIFTGVLASILVTLLGAIERRMVTIRLRDLSSASRG